MADPKYANLPGIDVNSPDVFETSELPEDEQNFMKPEELCSESVEQITLDSDAAFRVFKGKRIDVGKTDFSDNVGKSRAIGYFAEKTEYEVLGQDQVKETPQQKYQRLQYEMRELAEELSKIKEKAQQTDTDDLQSPVVLGKQLEYLQHQLADLHLEKLLGPEARVDLTDPQGALRQRLLTQLQSFKTTSSAKSEQKRESTFGKDHVLYELYYKPEQAQFSKNARLAKLEERLDRLENVIGKNFDKMNILAADTDNKSLIGLVGTLNSKLSLLDASNTETVEARLNAVLQKLQQINEKKEKEQQTDPDKQKKISDLFDLTKKWEATAESLPQIVNRLVSLQELHEQALQFSQALSHLDTAQQEVKASLTANSDMQKQLQGNLAENNNIIQQNIESFERRLNTLGK